MSRENITKKSAVLEIVPRTAGTYHLRAISLKMMHQLLSVQVFIQGSVASAAAVVVVAAPAVAIAAAAEQDDKNDDDPAAVISAKTTVTHKRYLLLKCRFMNLSAEAFVFRCS